tara:strand:+ start:1740 stop:2831 length:1092 start_codon:yes stop_codon:yes gene_type:complete
MEIWRKFLKESEKDPLSPTPEEEEALMSLPDRGKKNKEKDPLSPTPEEEEALMSLPDRGASIKKAKKKKKLKKLKISKKFSKLPSFSKAPESPSSSGVTTAAAFGSSSGPSSSSVSTSSSTKVSRSAEPFVKNKSLNSSGKIAAVGDSITVGIGSGGKSYIDLLGGFKSARGGYSSQILIKKGYVEKAIKSNPEYLVVFMGLNNPMQGNSNGACYGNGSEWVDKLINDLRSIYSLAASNGIKIIGITIPNASRIWSRKHKRCLGPNRKYCCKGKKVMHREPSVLWNNFQKVNSVIKNMDTNGGFIVDTTSFFGDSEGTYDYDKLGMDKASAPDGIHPGPSFHNWLAGEIQKNIVSSSTDNQDK